MTLLLIAFRQLFSKTESKESNLYTHLVEFRKRLYKHQLLFLYIALNLQTKTTFGFVWKEDIFEDYYTRFSLKKELDTNENAIIKAKFAITFLAGSEMK